MLRRLLGLGKKDEEEEKDEKEAEVEEKKADVEEKEDSVTEETPVEKEMPQEEEPEEEISAPAETIPYHASLQDRLKYLLTEPVWADSIEAPDHFSLEFMAMGERFHVTKESMGEVKIESGTSPDEDVFIRIANDVTQELLDAPSFEKFSEIYLKYYKDPGPGKFVKIELRKPITNLNRRGYARVPTLKLLIGAAR